MIDDNPVALTDYVRNALQTLEFFNFGQYFDIIRTVHTSVVLWRGHIRRSPLHFSQAMHYRSAIVIGSVASHIPNGRGLKLQHFFGLFDVFDRLTVRDTNVIDEVLHPKADVSHVSLSDVIGRVQRR